MTDTSKTVGSQDRAGARNGGISARAEEAAWRVIHACAGADGLLRAAAGSALYPHVWTRDVGLASLGMLAAARSDADRTVVERSLAALAKAQSRLGRMPLKIDPRTGREVSENSAGVDAGLWFAVATRALIEGSGGKLGLGLAEPAVRGVVWCMHLDQNGDGLLETPEASDWADMMPHRHAVLFVNVLYAEALRAASTLVTATKPDAGLPSAAVLLAEAARVTEAVRTVFRVSGATDAAGVGAHLGALERLNPEWAITGQYASRHGDLPFFLPYVAHRAVGTHCDVVGNTLAVITGAMAEADAHRLLDYLDRVGAAAPHPTKTIYPPLYPGAPDWRDHFHWRNLNLPHHYQNGGSWPFTGALHVAALVKAGERARAEDLLAALERACLHAGVAFPEWQHGQTGASMGEPEQLWSAAGLLFASVCVARGDVPFLGADPGDRGRAP